MNKVYDNMARIVYEARVLQIMEAEEAKKRSRVQTGLGGLGVLAATVGGAHYLKKAKAVEPAAATAAEDPSTKSTTRGTPMWKVLGHPSREAYQAAKTKHAQQRYHRTKDAVQGGYGRVNPDDKGTSTRR